ncbi:MULTISPECIES: UpxY family transcription antiterminator [Bacteroides]|uniref:UpxY family transcription antiterminator n=1 Tax=Bacteroides TaxID=816 RepID=UPI0018A09073|nr:MULTISPECIES: UpxY family transcription antiterminator [Bacteroides]MDC1767468.1 UpxY family transcription antiterminator [Bacteroides uniformis]MDC1771092.1 UpxY family transcription antiterminator [Bacteroides uniformis]MDC1777330.1 UpxY family transcription antiterminator [Bacteroides uniformis]MDC1778771.1 UpxY family transcription antiterminator [Bacteroides uniformis]
MSWFVMRDLKRRNSKLPAYKLLSNEHFEVFTPMKWEICIKRGKRVREEIPFIQDLLFVHSTKEKLDSIVDKTETLQYRYLRGGTYCNPMTVPDGDMERFMNAVSSTGTPRYYLPGELTPSMYGRKVRIIGGPLNNYEGHLLSIRGSKVKRLLVELPNFFSAGIEVKPEFIEIL